MDWSLISNFFIAMTAIVNPLGKVPLWLQASTGEEGSVRWRLAILVTLTAFVILLVSLLAGKPFLELFGVDLASFRVGGGVVILLLAIKMIGGTAMDIEADEDEEAEGSKFRQAQSRFKRVVVPMAMPILAGPGSISIAIVYSARAEGLTDYLMPGFYHEARKTCLERITIPPPRHRPKLVMTCRRDLLKTEEPFMIKA